MESARSMIYGSGVPKYLWAEVVNTAIYVLNRTAITQAVNTRVNTTLYELWFGKKPSLQHVRTFGCEAYVLTPEQKRTKLDPKSQKKILVGYDNNSENYKLFDLSTKKITISRNVLFNETNQGFENVTPQTSIMVEGNDSREIQENEVEGRERFVAVQETQGREGSHQLEEVEGELQEEDEGEPNLRPKRQIHLPARFDNYELNFVETDIPQSYERQ